MIKMGGIYEALLKVQEEITNPTNTATNPFLKSKYAPLPDILNQVRPLLSKNKIILLQNTGSNDGIPFIQTKLIYAGGDNNGAETVIETEKLCLKPDKNTAQGIGGAITYGRRYQLSALLGISSEDDNDGNSPKGRQTQPAKQPPKQSEPKQPKTSKTGKQSRTNQAEVSNVVNGETRKWKELTKQNKALKKVCDNLNNAGLDIHTVNINAEATDMNSKGTLTDKELDEIEVLLGKKG